MTTLLIVDDDPDASNSIRAVAVSCGYTPLLAQTAPLGLQLARHSRPQLAVLAMRTHDGDGCQTLRALRTLSPHIQALATSESTLNDDELDRALIAGFCGFLRKPIAASVLQARLQQMRVRAPATAAIGSLLDYLDHVRALKRTSDAGNDERSTRLARRLAWTLADPALTLFEFIAVARTLRLVTTGCSRGWVIDEMMTSLRRAASCDIRHVNPRVIAVISDLERATGQPTFGRQPCTVPESVATLVRNDTGHTVPQLRRMIFVRTAIRALALTDEHVRQIAFHIGYAHPSECDRDFHQVLNMTPTTYRALFRGESSRLARRSLRSRASPAAVKGPGLLCRHIPPENSRRHRRG